MFLSSLQEITWSDFLNFLENEEAKRSLVNEARLYGFGIKRFKHGKRLRIKYSLTRSTCSHDSTFDYFIDSLVMINLDSSQLCLALFENHNSKLYSTKDF